MDIIKFIKSKFKRKQFEYINDDLKDIILEKSTIFFIDIKNINKENTHLIKEIETYATIFIISDKNKKYIKKKIKELGIEKYIKEIYSFSLKDIPLGEIPTLYSNYNSLKMGRNTFSLETDAILNKDWLLKKGIQESHINIAKLIFIKYL